MTSDVEIFINFVGKYFFAMNVTERFLRYVKFDTQSDELTNLTPSTPGQFKFAQALEKELRELGLSDISLDDNGYLMATLPSNVGRVVPTVGFIAHLDTSPDMSGKNVNPRIVEGYDGGDIVLNKQDDIILSPREFPELLHYKGEDLIVLLGDGFCLRGCMNGIFCLHLCGLCMAVMPVFTSAERRLEIPYLLTFN